MDDLVDSSIQTITCDKQTKGSDATVRAIFPHDRVWPVPQRPMPSPPLFLSPPKH